MAAICISRGITHCLWRYRSRRDRQDFPLPFTVSAKSTIVPRLISRSGDVVYIDQIQVRVPRAFRDDEQLSPVGMSDREIVAIRMVGDAAGVRSIGVDDVDLQVAVARGTEGHPFAVG